MTVEATMVDSEKAAGARKLMTKGPMAASEG
jgi:hypothetical protein